MPTAPSSLVVLTGAGLSAASGIRTFRDTGGLWEGHRPEDVATPEAFAADPELVHRFYNARRQQLLTCEPNPAHQALAKLTQKFSVTTDDNGHFSLEGVAAGTRNFEFSAPSYHSLERRFSIWPDRLTATRVRLNPDPNGEAGDLTFDVLPEPDPDTGESQIEVSWPAHWIDPQLELSTDMETWIPAGESEDNTLTVPAEPGTIYFRMRYQP